MASVVWPVRFSQQVPQLPADWFVRLAGRPADRDHHCSRLFGECRPLYIRRHENERSLGRVPSLAIQFENGASSGHDVQLFVRVILASDAASATARVTTEAGSSTISNNRTVLPPSVSGLNC